MSVTYRSDVTVELVDHMGDIQRIAAAARVSTGTTGTDTENAGLIRYLYNNRHASPFEHVVFTFRVEAPIFVTREMLRHRVGSFNEESGRYSILKPVFYMPAADRPLVQVGKVGHYEFEPGTAEHRAVVEAGHHRAYSAAWASYERMIEAGIAREVARNVLPVGIYSSLYWTVNLRSLLNFLSLRVDWGDEAANRSHPTHEIQEVARRAFELALVGRLCQVGELFRNNGYRPL